MKQTIQQKLQAVANLAEFSRLSEIPLRTLRRILAGHVTPHRSTERLIEMALEQHRPAKKPAGQQ